MSEIIITVIPTFNRAHTLGRALDSVRAQTIATTKCIVIDDASTDSTSELLDSYKNAHPTFPLEAIHLNQNSGVSAARNQGIKKHLEINTNTWFALLDSDDEWLPERLELQMGLIINNPKIKLIHGEEIWIRNGVRVNQMKKHKKYGGRVFEKCLPLCSISPSASLIHLEVFQICGLFDENFPVCEDYDFWLRSTCRFNVGFIETPIIKKYGGHEDQLSRKLKAMDLWRIKSMLNIKNRYSDHLDINELNALNRQLDSKRKILTNGYKKRNLLENIDSLNNLFN